MASANVTELNNENFGQTVLQSKGTYLVDFWAEWCGPCKMIAPLIDQLADENTGKLSVGKVNVDNASDVASQFNIRSIPTLIIFSDGKVKDQIVGMTSKKDLEKRLGLVAA